MLVFILPACSAVATSALDRVEGCLLLRNGNVLSGRIAREGEYYRVAQERRGEIVVPCCAGSSFFADRSRKRIVRFAIDRT